VQEISKGPVVVTGGKGFLGRFVTAELERRGFSVHALGSSDYDLTCPYETAQMFRDIEPRLLIHLAAAVGGIGANRLKPGWFSYANTMMGANVLEGGRRHHLDKVVVIGTICVYPRDATVPTPESEMFDGFPANDTAPYGIAKRNLWMMGWAYREQYGLRTIYLIPTNLYGPQDHFEEERSHVIPALIRRFIEAREDGTPAVTIWGDGSATREFLYVEDAARGIVDALEGYDEPSVVNLGSGREVSIRKLAEAIRDLTGYVGAIKWDPTKPVGAPRRSLDVKLARRKFGFSARMELGEGLARTVAWYETQRGKGTS
jgi:GDP-L-fucose synthase